jgi:hypothetical protein
MEYRENNPKPFFKALFIGIAIALLCAFALALQSCNTAKRASRLIDKANRIDNTVMPGKCALLFPNADSSIQQTVYKEGKTIYRQAPPIHTTTNCDSIFKAAQKDKSVDPKNVQTPCPPCDSMRVDTFYINNYAYITNTAEKVTLINKLNAANQTISAKDNTIKWLKWIAISGWALIIVVIAWKVFKPKL